MERPQRACERGRTILRGGSAHADLKGRDAKDWVLKNGAPKALHLVFDFRLCP